MHVRLAASPLPALLACLVFTAGAAGQAERGLPGSGLVFDGGTSLVVADVNGDGRADLITSAADYPEGSIRLARPDGTFGPAVTYAGSANPTAVADFTEDGLVDVLCFTNSVRVLPGLGQGSFGAVIKTPALKPSSTHAVSVGDFDLDGHLDFSWTFEGAHIVYLQAGNGDGTFAVAPQLVQLGSAFAESAGLADMDGDGDLDVYASAYVNPLGGFSTQFLRFPNDGSGAMAAPQVLTEISHWAAHVALFDFDQDGLMDFAASGDTNELTLRLVRGTPSGFSVQKVFTFLGAGYPGDFAATPCVDDVDGDGIADLLYASSFVGSPGGPTFFLKGAGAFNFEPPVPSLTNFSQPSSGTSAFSGFRFADVDGDEHLDVLQFRATLAGIKTTDVIEMAPGHGDGHFETSKSVETGVVLTDVAAGDLDGDGVTDLLATSTYLGPHLLARIGAGDGTFAQGPQATATSFAGRVLAADLDADGRTDAVVSDAGALGGAEALPGQGDGSFASPLSISQQPVRDAALGDLDLDGYLDLVLSQPGLGGVTLWAGTGGDRFVAAGLLPVGTDAGGVALGDVTGDGRADVVVAREMGSSAFVFPSEGGLGTEPPFELATNPFPHAVLAADLDGDGSADVVAACGETGFGSTDRAVSVHRALGGGSFGATETWPVDVVGMHLAAADFDRDSLVDLVVSTIQTKFFVQDGSGDIQEPGVEVLHGAPGGLPGQRVAIRSGGLPSGFGIGDFDGNGYPDLAVGLADNFDIRVHLNSPATWSTLGNALPSSGAVPLLSGAGAPVPDRLVTVTASLVPQPALGFLIVGLHASFLSVAGGVLVPSPDVIVPIVPNQPLSARWPKSIPEGTPVYFQAWFQDLVTGAVSATNALVTIGQ